MANIKKLILKKIFASKNSYQKTTGNMISSFLALQVDVLVQQHDLLEQNKEINHKLLDITFKFNFLVKQNEKLSSEAAISKNASKVLQGAFQKMANEFVELGRNQHQLEQYLRR